MKQEATKQKKKKHISPGRNRISRLRRQDEAPVRQAEHDSLSTEEKVAKLDKKLGKGEGAKKERTRLASPIRRKKNANKKKKAKTKKS